ncbi:MAG: DHHA1 domain-containing protein [Candidatus Methanomethylophilaceae archaeon]|jgi:alanyl-tRNA synthetase
MTEELFRHDGYQFEFGAEVVSAEGDRVVLDKTAFYPGGGGQVCDTGFLNGVCVTETFYGEDGNIVHIVPGNSFKKGDGVWGSVDWERRFDLMAGHTGEHLLFCSLKREVPDLEIVKIFISPENKYVIVNGEIGWETVRKALRFANSVISDNLTVERVMMSRDDPDFKEKVRMKAERLPEKGDVCIVEIGDIDYSACSGIHVMETSEIGMLFVDRIVSAGRDGTSVHFKVGKAAAEAAAELAMTCMETAEAADSKPEDLVKAVSNLKRESEFMKKALRKVTGSVLSSVVPILENGNEIYAASVPGADRGILSEKAEKVKKDGGTAIFVSEGESLSVIVSSGNENVDCKKILGETLREFGGRGGGKKDFAQGGVPDTDVSEKLLAALVEKAKEAVSAQR